MAKEIVGVLLAAGSGSRFGGDKLLHPLNDGTPIGVAAARNLKGACRHVVAVVRPGDLALASMLTEEGCEVVPCIEPQGGMGRSLATGVQAAAQAYGWIVALGDMPFIRLGTYQAIAANLRQGAMLVATQYRGQRGHPVGFSKVWLPQLLSLTGDQGGKPLLERHLGELLLLSLGDPGVLQDIDYRQDVASQPKIVG